MNIRAITFEDIHICAKLHQEAFAKGWSQDDFQALLNNKNIKILGMFDTTILVGVIIFLYIACEAEIYTLFVKKDFQKKGIASALLRKIERDTSCPINRIYLDVAENNIAARKLYLANGFCEYHRRPDYYKTDIGCEDAILMQKNII